LEPQVACLVENLRCFLGYNVFHPVISPSRAWLGWVNDMEEQVDDY
jgi:hypothetical protein